MSPCNTESTQSTWEATGVEILKLIPNTRGYTNGVFYERANIHKLEVTAPVQAQPVYYKLVSNVNVGNS